MKAINKMLAALALVVVLVLGAVVTAAVYSNGFESLAPLYLTDGENVIADSLDVPADGATLYLKRAGFDKAIGSYTVEVLPNPEYDFDYTADGKNYRYSTAFDNLTAAFDISETQGGLVLEINGGITDVLAQLHGTDNISADILDELFGVHPYVLHIYTDYGETSITFGQVRRIALVVGNGDGYIYH